MAKATVTCTCAKCGKEFTINAFKPNRREADQFVAWAQANITECRECEEKRIAEERAAENAKSAEAAAEKGWPLLTGTEKQIAWANTIRERAVAELMIYRRESRRVPNSVECFDACLSRLLYEQHAAWWIDNRDTIDYVFRGMIREYLADPEICRASEAERQAAAESKDDATIAEPVEKTHDGFVDITAAESRVSAAYRKDDDFRALVKELGYRWNGAEVRWELQIGIKTGTSAERAAELGNRLLNAGFAIRIQDQDTLRNAIEGKYEPMCRRWICRVGNKDIFAISWAREDDIYSKAKRLPCAQYSNGEIVVPGREYKAVLDFAEVYGFRFSAGAQKLIEEMQVATVVDPAEAKMPEYEEKPLSQVLKSSRDVLEDLKD